MYRCQFDPQQRNINSDHHKCHEVDSLYLASHGTAQVSLQDILAVPNQPIRQDPSENSPSRHARSIAYAAVHVACPGGVDLENSTMLLSMHEQSSRLVAAFRMVHDASLGRETLGMHAAAIGGCLLILWKIQTTRSSYVVRRQCCVFRSVLHSGAQSLLRRSALHASAIVNLSSALLARWQTVSLLATSCFLSTTD